MINNNVSFISRIKNVDENFSICHVRQHKFNLGKTISFDIEDPFISSMEYLISAFGGDLIYLISRIAKKKGIEISDIEGVVKCQLENSLVYLGVIGEKGVPRIEEVSIKIYISTLHSNVEIEKVIEDALLRSPLFNTFKESINIKIEHKLIL